MTIEDIVIALLGRDRAWRFARGLYMRARGEKRTNAIESNGERDLIANVIGATAATGRQPILFDIGANKGEWSSVAIDIARSAGTTLSLHIFEAAPQAAAELRETFDGRDGVHVHEIAMSDRTGTAQFAIVDQTAGTNSLELDSVSPGTRHIEVAVSTGGAIVRELALDHLDLVKVDTEGHDFNVIVGFEPLLAAKKIGVLQFEYNSRWLSAHRSLRDVFALAEKYGYRVGRVVPSAIELLDAWNSECDRFFEDNYALVSPNAATLSFVRQMRWSVSNTLTELRL